jgi:hypothetical protein
MLFIFFFRKIGFQIMGFVYFNHFKNANFTKQMLFFRTNDYITERRIAEKKTDNVYTISNLRILFSSQLNIFVTSLYFYYSMVIS